MQLVGVLVERRAAKRAGEAERAAAAKATAKAEQDEQRAAAEEHQVLLLQQAVLRQEAAAAEAARRQAERDAWSEQVSASPRAATLLPCSCPPVVPRSRHDRRRTLLQWMRVAPLPFFNLRVCVSHCVFAPSRDAWLACTLPIRSASGARPRPSSGRPSRWNSARRPTPSAAPHARPGEGGRARELDRDGACQASRRAGAMGGESPG